MKPDISECYRAFDDAETLLIRLAASCNNTDIDWEDILERSYTRVLPRLFERFRAVDAGCHLGVHTDALLKLDALEQVDCFEPVPRYASHLRDRYRRDSRVRVHQLALADRAGERSFVLNRTAPGESGLRQRSFYNDPAAELERIQVRCERLDALELTSLGFLKIDTEGGEIDILRGAERLLAKHRPLVAVEFGIGGFDAYGYTPADLLAITRSHDYCLTDLFFNRCDPEAFAERICSRFYWDYFLVPSEHLAALAAMKETGAFD